MDFIYKLMTMAAFYAAVKAMGVSWLLTEAVKRIARMVLSREVPSSATWVFAILSGAGFGYWLHSGLDETANPTAFFALGVGLLTPVIHHIVAIQGLSILESFLAKRFNLVIDLRAAVTGNKKYKQDKTKPSEEK